jgi:(1->4)-alpha-D-glucan 1-alpha-D-glucosylmutase
VVAFARRHDDEVFVVVVPRLLVGHIGQELRDPIGEVWGDTRLRLPHAEDGAMYQDLLTFTFHTAAAAEHGAAIPLSTLFAHLPMALLHRVR